MNTEILTANGVDIQKGLELLGDMEMYNDTLRDFLDESATRLPKIQEYAANGDMPNYAILVHAMKSDSKYLGFAKLAEMALEHQLKSEDGDKTYIKEHYQELEEEVNRIIDIVKNYLA